MSSVGNSDSADRAADKNLLRRTRDEFRNRESDLIKRQNVEARRVAERNADEIATLKEKHSEQLDSARDHSHDAITKQDHRYQREIEDIRNLHRKQLQSSADETSQREKTFRRAINSDTTNRAKHNDERFDKLNDDFKTKSQAEAENYGERIREGRETQEKSVGTMREKLIDRHETEMDALRTTLQDKIAKEEGNFSAYRREIAGQRREAQTHDLQQGKEQSEKLMSAVRNERLDRSQNEAHLREDYSESLGDQRERYAEALERTQDEFKEASSDFRAQSQDRGTGKINSLRRENKDLREQNVRDVSQVKHASAKELKNARDSFQKNVDAYRRERDESSHRVNAGDRREVRQMREGLEQRVRDEAAGAREKMDDQTRTYKREFENVKDQYEDRIELKDNLSERRVEHVIGEATDEKARLTQLNEDNHQAAQRSKQDEMKALRSTLESDKRGSVDSMREMMRKQELHHAERMGSVVAKYDKQIQSLKDEMTRERRLGTETTKRSIDELRRAHQLDMDQAETKNRAKLTEATARHEQEVRNVSKRYEEKLDQVLAEMKKS